MHARRQLSGMPSIAVVIGAFLMAGCATQQESNDSAPAARATKTAATVARPLTTAQLKALTFKEGEVPQAREGAIPVQEPQPESDQNSFPPVSDPACQTVLDHSDAKAASARVVQIFNWKNDIWPGSSTLASYEDTKAQSSFEQLEEGLKKCRSFTGTGYVGEYRAKLIVENAPHVGDEAVSYRIKIPLGDDGARDEQHIVVRVGSVIATFTRLDVGGSSSFPSDLIHTQVERLRTAQRI